MRERGEERSPPTYPHTVLITNLGERKAGQRVNLGYDLPAKSVERQLQAALQGGAFGVWKPEGGVRANGEKPPLARHQIPLRIARKIRPIPPAVV
jgi:hypothetical protein